MQKTFIGLLLVFSLFTLASSIHAQTSTKHYYYTDPQGTVLAKADAQGNIVERYEYTPYGVPVPSVGAAPAGMGYTGHVNDPETGLVYMQARYYDPVVGRFLSIDPVTPAENPAEAFNRYWYANDNPYKYMDSDGREVEYAAGTADDFKKNFAKAIKYLNAVGAAANFAKLQESKQVFLLQPAEDRTNGYQTVYNSKTKTITWADKGGVKVMDSKTGKLESMSPAMAVGHEAQHGVHDLQGTFTKDNSTKDAQFQTKEERMVITGYENDSAKKLNEPIRTDHYGHGEVTCQKVTQC